MPDEKDQPPKIQTSPLAYENSKFLNGPDGRVLRIEAEYLEPLSRFRRQRIQDTVVFFGSARFHSRSAAQNALELLEKPGSRQTASPEWEGAARRAQADLQMAQYFEDARQLAFLLTRWSLSLSTRHQ